MNKVQTKRFAVLALLLSLVLGVTAFALLGVRSTAKAAGETELILPREFVDSRGNGFAIPITQLSNYAQGGVVGAEDADKLAKVYVKRGTNTYASSHIYTWANLAIYFNNSGYLSQAVQTGDQLVIEAGLTFQPTGSTETFICTNGASWTFDGTSWKADWEEEEEDLSGYTDMQVTGMTVSGRHRQVPVTVITDSANAVDVGAAGGSDAVAVSYAAFRFPDGTPGDVWYCRKDKEQANFFVRTKENAADNIDTVAKLPIGSIFTAKRGFRLDTVSALKEEVSFIFRGTEWEKYVPATEFTADSAVELLSGGTAQIGVTTTPADATDLVTYTVTSGADVIEVSASGLITSKKTGTATVSVKVGALTAQTVNVTVTSAAAATGIEVTGEIEVWQYDDIKNADISKLAGKYVIGANKYDMAIEKSMIPALQSVNTDTAGKVPVQVQTQPGDTLLEATVQVNVKASKALSVVNSGCSNGNVLWVMFDSTDSEYNFNDPYAPPADTNTILQNMAPFVVANLKTANGATPTLAMQLNYITAQNNRTVNLYWNSGIAHTRGDVVTLKKGFPAVATATVSERLTQDITFVFNGEQWVELIEPTAVTITEKPTTLYLNVTHKLQIATTPANANGVLTFESSNPDYVTVSDDGVITPKQKTDATTQTVTVTVKYKGLSDSIAFAITDAPVVTGIVVEDKIPAYYVPVSKTDAPTSLFGEGFTLKYHYTYEGTEAIGPSTDVTPEMLGTFDYTQTGDRPLTVSVTVGDDVFTDTVMIRVYEVKTLSWWQDLGVDGYGDDRNKPNQYNGCMLITARNYSSSGANITGQDVDTGVKELNKMLEYVTYTTKAGEVYTAENKKIGGWLLGSTILINANGKGFTGAPENGYQLGDKVTFREGMPLYGWSGELYTTEHDSHTPKAGTGCMYVIGRLDADYTYFCYEQNDTYSLWSEYIEYSDFTVSGSVTISVEGTGSLNAALVTADARSPKKDTGVFRYVSSDTSVVTVNDTGNLVGVKEGTATVTVTVVPFEASGYQKELPAKTVNVTVKKGIASIEGAFTVKPGAVFDPAAHKIKVTYTDGSSEEIALNDDRVQAEDVNTSEVGENVYKIIVTIDGVTKRGTFTVAVKEDEGCGCGGSAAAGSIAFGGTALVLALAAVAIRKKRKA